MYNSTNSAMNFPTTFHRHRKYLILGLFISLISLMLTAILSKTWTFFHTKSTTISSFNPDIAIQVQHTPQMTWLDDSKAVGRKMEEETRKFISRDYIAAWAEWNLYFQTGDNSRLHDYFHRDILHKMPPIPMTSPITLQTDIAHHLALYLYSEDGQLVTFTDKSMEYIRQGLTQSEDSSSLIYTQHYNNDIQVVMVLDDGNWKIKNWEYLSPSKSLETKATSTTEASFFSVKDKKLQYKGQIFESKGINYYPQKHPWEMWGKNFDRKTLHKDFAWIHDLGFNTVRFFLPFEEMGKGNVDMELLSQIEVVLDEAAANDLKVIPTLFDFNSDYRLSNWAATDRQLESILDAFKDREEIIAYDIKNEPDLDFRSSHQKLVLDWLDFTLKKARTYDANHLFTVGWSDAGKAHLLSDKVDFVSFHFYKDIAQLCPDIDSLQSKIGIQMIMLEEFGMTTYRAWWYGGKTEKEQSDYFQHILTILEKKEKIPFLVWTLYDFSAIPTRVAGDLPQHRYPQKNFGIANEQSQLKPVYQTIKHFLHP